MADLRQLEADLAQNVEDKVSQALGYREYQVFIGNQELLPRPPVEEIDSARFSEQLAAKLLQATSGGLPSAVFKIEVSRNVPEDLVRSRDTWKVQRGTRVSHCKLVSIGVTAARFEVIVAVLKNQVNL